MSGELIYAFRVMRLPLLDAGGDQIGRLDDIVVIPGRPGKGREPAIPPRVVGFVASSQRRSIFVNANRIATLDSDGARLRSWDVDLNPFKPRPGEVLIGEHLIDRKVGDETVSDIALRDFHPAEVAAVVRALPVDQRRQLAEAMDDERLADVLEELSEEEQIRIVS